MNNEDFQKWAEFYFKEAQKKGQEKFHLWKDTDFQAEIEGLTTKERHFLINQTLLSLKSWYKNNVKNKALFDVINVPESELLKEWVNAVEFLNSVEGKIHNLSREPKEIPGNSEFNKWILTPRRVEQKLDLHGYDSEFWENLSPSAISCWTIALSECYKVNFCLKYLENLLSNSPEPVKQEANTKKWALFYWFLMEANVKPEIRGSKKKLKELAQKHNLSEDNFYYTFNAVNQEKRPKNPMKVGILKEVIPMLEEYPTAKAKAEKELQKHIKK